MQAQSTRPRRTRWLNEEAVAGLGFASPFIIGFDSSSSRCGPSADTAADGQAGDLPVPVQGACVHARVYDHAGSHGRLR